MGYRPDPVLASLNAYRRTQQPIQRGQTLVWFGSRPHGQAGRYELVLFEAAQARAQELGYRMDYFWGEQPGYTLQRYTQIFNARGVAGVVFAPREAPHSKIELEIKDFAAVAMGRSVDWPPVDRVSPDHFQTMETCYAAVWERGFRRIGFAMTESYSERIAGLWVGAFLRQQLRYCTAAPQEDEAPQEGTTPQRERTQQSTTRKKPLPKGGARSAPLQTTSQGSPQDNSQNRTQNPSQGIAIPPYLDRDTRSCGMHDLKRFEAWYTHWQPDAILTMGWRYGCIPLLQTMGLHYPRDVGLALMVVPRHDPALTHYSGIAEPVEELGSFCVDVLAERIRNNVRGIASSRRVHLLPGHWNEGHTLRHL